MRHLDRPVGSEVKYIRQRRGMTQAQLLVAMGNKVAPSDGGGNKGQFISMLESGRKGVSVAYLERIAEATNSRLFIKFVPLEELADE